MNTDSPSPERAAIGGFSIFIRGFFIRLVYGLMIVPVIALTRPDMFTENPAPLIFGLNVYLFVCIAGGAYDVSIGRVPRFSIWSQYKSMNIVSVATLIVILFTLWAFRPC